MESKARHNNIISVPRHCVSLISLDGGSCHYHLYSVHFLGSYVINCFTPFPEVRVFTICIIVYVARGFKQTRPRKTRKFTLFTFLGAFTRGVGARCQSIILVGY